MASTSNGTRARLNQGRCRRAPLSRSFDLDPLSYRLHGDFRAIWELKIWQEVIERFEEQAPGAVMAHLALDRALPANWIDEVFQAHRQRQYPRELLFSGVVELMLAAVGLKVHH